MKKKVAILIDQMIEKNWTHRILNNLCQLYERPTIFTLAFRFGAVEGACMESTVISTPLSHFISKTEKIYYFKGLIPSFIDKWKKSLSEFSHCFVITQGLIAISSDILNGKIIYITTHNLKNGPAFSKFGVFSPLLKRNFHRSLQSSKGVMLISNSHGLGEKNGEMIFDGPKILNYFPPFKVSNFVPISNKVNTGKYLVFTKELNSAKINSICYILEKNKLKYDLLSEVECTGALSKKMVDYKAIINIGKVDTFFNEVGMLAISLGIPQIFEKNSILSPLQSKKIGLSVNSQNENIKNFEEKMNTLLLQMETEWDWFIPNEINMIAKQFDAIRFNPQVVRFLKQTGIDFL